MSIRYTEKKSVKEDAPAEKKQAKEELTVESFNLQVVQKQNKTVRRLEKTVSFGVLHIYDSINKEWSRAKCEGPLFLAVKDNARMLIIFMNQLNRDNKQIDIGDHMEFELKKKERDGRMDYFLNIKRPDSLLKTEILGIWSEDPQLESLYTMLKQLD